MHCRLDSQDERSTDPTFPCVNTLGASTVASESVIAIGHIDCGDTFRKIADVDSSRRTVLPILQASCDVVWSIYQLLANRDPHSMNVRRICSAPRLTSPGRTPPQESPLARRFPVQIPPARECAWVYSRAG